MKLSQTIWIAAFAVIAAWMLLDKSVEVIHGPTPESVPQRREGMLRSLVRALAHWGLDRAIQQPPPVEALTPGKEDVPLHTPTLSLHMPSLRPSEFLSHEGDDVDHHQGW